MDGNNVINNPQKTHELSFYLDKKSGTYFLKIEDVNTKKVANNQKFRLFWSNQKDENLQLCVGKEGQLILNSTSSSNFKVDFIQAHPFLLTKTNTTPKGDFYLTLGDQSYMELKFAEDINNVQPDSMVLTSDFTLDDQLTSCSPDKQAVISTKDSSNSYTFSAFFEDEPIFAFETKCFISYLFIIREDEIILKDFTKSYDASKTYCSNQENNSTSNNFDLTRTTAAPSNYVGYAYLKKKASADRWSDSTSNFNHKLQSFTFTYDFSDEGSGEGIITVTIDGIDSRSFKTKDKLIPESIRLYSHAKFQFIKNAYMTSKFESVPIEIIDNVGINKFEQAKVNEEKLINEICQSNGDSIYHYSKTYNYTESVIINSQTWKEVTIYTTKITTEHMYYLDIKYFIPFSGNQNIGSRSRFRLMFDDQEIGNSMLYAPTNWTLDDLTINGRVQSVRPGEHTIKILVMTDKGVHNKGVIELPHYSTSLIENATPKITGNLSLSGLVSSSSACS